MGIVFILNLKSETSRICYSPFDKPRKQPTAAPKVVSIAEIHRDMVYVYNALKHIRYSDDSLSYRSLTYLIKTRAYVYRISKV